MTATAAHKIDQIGNSSVEYQAGMAFNGRDYKVRIFNGKLHVISKRPDVPSPSIEDFTDNANDNTDDSRPIEYHRELYECGQPVSLDQILQVEDDVPVIYTPLESPIKKLQARLEAAYKNSAPQEDAINQERIDEIVNKSVQTAFEQQSSLLKELANEMREPKTTPKTRQLLKEFNYSDLINIRNGAIAALIATPGFVLSQQAEVAEFVSKIFLNDAHAYTAEQIPLENADIELDPGNEIDAAIISAISEGTIKLPQNMDIALKTPSGNLGRVMDAPHHLPPAPERPVEYSLSSTFDEYNPQPDSRILRLVTRFIPKRETPDPTDYALTNGDRLEFEHRVRANEYHEQLSAPIPNTPQETWEHGVTFKHDGDGWSLDVD